jgi:bacillithiol biosynthesis deacetylase BshB1
MSRENSMLDVLVVAPHPDDAELAAAGAILHFKAAGKRVGILDLTSGEPTPRGSLPTRAGETAAATEILGVDWRENLGLPNRSLQHTLDARRALAGVFRRLRPRWIFAPFWEDAHPDHLVATELIEAAKFWAKLSKSDIEGEPFFPERIYHYYSVHLKLTPQPAFILDISAHWEQKRAAIACYESQFTGEQIERLRDQAANWGYTIGTAYGEPFACREPVGLASLCDLV